MPFVAHIIFGLFGGALMYKAEPDKLPIDVIRYLPEGAEPLKWLRQDLDGDGRREWIIAARIIDCTSMWEMMSELHTILVVLTPKDKTLKVIGCRDVGQHFERLQTANLLGDGTIQVAVTTMYWGADNESTHMQVFNFRHGSMQFVHEFSGVRFEDYGGGVELRDYSSRPLAEVKTWTEFHRPEQSNAQVHEHITAYWRWNGSRFMPYRQHIYDRNDGRVTQTTRSAVYENLGWTKEPDVGGFTPYAGKVKCLTDGLVNCASPAWSPDGKRIAFTSGRGLWAGKSGELESMNLWLMNADGSDKRKLASFGTIVDNPQWSPDGKLLAFRSLGGENSPPDRVGQFIIDIESGKIMQIGTDAEIAYWLATGKGMYQLSQGILHLDGSAPTPVSKEPPLYNIHAQTTNGAKVYWLNRSIRFELGRRKFELVFKPGMNANPCLSPDGKQVAFMSFKRGVWGIWVTPMPH